jgi:hypothetical protein
MTNTTNTADDDKPNLLKEECMSFAEAARKLPIIRGDKPPAPETIWRWAKKGRLSELGRRTFLEYARIGGTNCTSMQALARFFTRLRDDHPPVTSGSPANPDPLSKPVTVQHNSPEKRAEQATEILRRRGIVK